MPIYLTEVLYSIKAVAEKNFANLLNLEIWWEIFGGLRQRWTLATGNLAKLQWTHRFFVDKYTDKVFDQSILHMWPLPKNHQFESSHAGVGGKIMCVVAVASVVKELVQIFCKCKLGWVKFGRISANFAQVSLSSFYAIKQI